jgi:hypothetical protein
MTAMLVFAIVPATVVAQDLGALQKNKKYIELRDKAETGDTQAKVEIGKLLRTGEEGFPKDELFALIYFESAAKKGNSDGQLWAGKMYYNGWGTKQNYKKALAWFKKSVEQGNCEAENMMAVAYYNGNGVKLDMQEALKWYIKAAEHGNKDALMLLGYYYYNGGIMVNQDFKEAKKWFAKAAEQDLISSSFMDVSFFGIGSERDMEESKKLAEAVLTQKSKTNAIPEGSDETWGLMNLLSAYADNSKPSGSQISDRSNEDLYKLVNEMHTLLEAKRATAAGYTSLVANPTDAKEVIAYKTENAAQLFDIFKKMGDIYLQRKDTLFAAGLLGLGKALDRGEYEAVRTMAANYFFNNGNYQKAFEMSNNSDNYYIAAVSAYRSGNAQEAERLYNLAVSNNVKFPDEIAQGITTLKAETQKREAEEQALLAEQKKEEERIEKEIASKGLFPREGPNGKLGFVDAIGRWVIKPQYKFTTRAHFSEFHEGLIYVQQDVKDGKYGYIDQTGKLVIPFLYEYAHNFSEGLAAVKFNGKYGYIDKTGKWVIQPQFTGGGIFSEGLAAAGLEESKYGYIDITGKWVIQPQFYKAERFQKNGFAIVGKTGTKYTYDLGLINRQGTLVVPMDYQRFDFVEDVVIGQIYGPNPKTSGFGTKAFLIHSNGKVIPAGGDLIYLGDGLYVQDYSTVIDKNGKKMDISGDWVILGYNNGFFFARSTNNKYAQINKKGEIVMPLDYDMVYLKGDCYCVKMDGKAGCVDKGGKILTPIVFLLASSSFFEGINVLYETDPKHGKILGYKIDPATGKINLPMPITGGDLRSVKNRLTNLSKELEASINFDIDYSDEIQVQTLFDQLETTTVIPEKSRKDYMERYQEFRLKVLNQLAVIRTNNFNDYEKATYEELAQHLPYPLFYDYYVRRFPNGSYIADFKEIIDRTDDKLYQAALSSGGQRAYLTYISCFPDGKYTAEARQKTEAMTAAQKQQLVADLAKAVKEEKDNLSRYVKIDMQDIFMTEGDGLTWMEAVMSATEDRKNHNVFVVAKVTNTGKLPKKIKATVTLKITTRFSMQVFIAHGSKDWIDTYNKEWYLNIPPGTSDVVIGHFKFQAKEWSGGGGGPILGLNATSNTFIDKNNAFLVNLAYYDGDIPESTLTAQNNLAETLRTNGNVAVKKGYASRYVPASERQYASVAPSSSESSSDKVESSQEIDPDNVEIPSYKVYKNELLGSWVEQKEDDENRWYKNYEGAKSEAKWIQWEEGKINMFIYRKKNPYGNMEYWVDNFFYDTEENARNAAYVFKKYGKIRKKGKQ